MVQAMNDTIWKDVWGRFKKLSSYIIAVLIDGVFLALWVATQYLLDRFVLAKLQLSGIDTWVLDTFKWCFAISTIIPIILFLLGDTIKMLFSFVDEIRETLRSFQEKKKTDVPEEEAGQAEVMKKKRPLKGDG